MSKFFSLITTLGLAVLLLCAGTAVVCASETEVLNESYVKGVKPPGWANLANTFISQTFEDGAMVLRHLRSNVGTTTQATYFKDCDMTAYVDAAGKTRLLSNQISGKFSVEMEFELDLSTDRAGATYASFAFGLRSRTATAQSLTNTLAQFRFYTSGSMQCAQPTSQGSGSAAVVFSTPYQSGMRNTLRLIFDTESGTFDTYFNETLLRSGTPMTVDFQKVFGSIRIQTMEATREDSYIKVYGIRINQIEESDDEAFIEARSVYDQLPAAFVDDPDSVRENISVPSLSPYGVTKLTASDANVLTAGGVITRDVADAPASLYGEFQVNSALYASPLIFKKAYDFTVKAFDGAEDTLIAEENAVSGFYESEWVFHETKGIHAFGAGGLTLTKIGRVADTVFHDPGSVGIRVYKIPADGAQTRHEALFDLTHTGIFEFDLSAWPDVSGPHPAFLDIGYQNPETGSFTAYVRFKFLDGTVSYEAGAASEIILENAGGESVSLKARVYAQDNKVKLWNGEDLLTAAGIEYGAQEIPAVNAVRAIIDENANMGDSFTLESARFVKRLGASDPVMEQLREAAEGLGISAVTDTPDDVYASLKELPASANGVPVKWRSDKPDAVNPETGGVYRSADIQRVTLFATLTKDGRAVVKEFYLTVNPATDPQELLDSAKQALTWEAVSRQPQSDLRYDVALPASGASGADITWSSSAPDILSADGKINKSVLIAQDAPVTLTARLTLDGIWTTKTFAVQIKKRGGENRILNETPASLDPYFFEIDGQANLTVMNDVTVSVAAQKNACSNGVISVVNSAGESLKSVLISGDGLSVDGAVVAQVPDNAAFTLSVTILPDVRRAAVWVNGRLCADYLPITAEFDGVSGVRVSGANLSANGVEVFLDDYGVLALNSTVFGYMDAIPAFVADRDLTLIGDSILGVEVSWASSNTAAIGADGKIVKGAGYGFSDLTLTLKNARVSAAYSRTLAVAPDETGHILVFSEFKSNAPPYAQHPLEYAFDQKPDTYFSGIVPSKGDPFVTITLEQESHVNQLFIHEYNPGISRYKIQYSHDQITWSEACLGAITDARSRLVQFSPVKAKYIKLTVTEVLSDRLDITEITALLTVSPEQLARIDLEELDLDTTRMVSGNLTLETRGKYGSVIAWRSSALSVISNSGIYTAPNENTLVILTAYVMVDGKAVQRMFPPLTAQGKNGAKGAAVMSSGKSGGGGGLTSPVLPSQLPEQTETPSDLVFDDVPETHWAYDTINTLSKAGVISGDGTGLYLPGRPVTREEFAKMLLCVDGKALFHDLPNAFVDVDSGQWYADYVLSAYQAKVVMGVSESEFGVGQNITRQDAAVMLSRLLDRVSDGAQGEDFLDGGDIAQYALDAVRAMQKTGIVQGYSGNVFKPLDFVSRAEAAAIIARFLSLKD